MKILRWQKKSQILLKAEPTGALDSEAGAAVLELLQRFCEEAPFPKAYTFPNILLIISRQQKVGKIPSNDKIG